MSAKHTNPAIPILIVTVILSAITQMAGLPGGVLAWLGITIAGFNWQMRGFKASEKHEDYVVTAQLRQAFWKTVAIKNIWPPHGWRLPEIAEGANFLQRVFIYLSGTLGTLYSVLFSIIAGLLFGTLPQLHVDVVRDALVTHFGMSPDIGATFQTFNAIAVTLVLISFGYARRITIDPQDESPGTRLSDALIAFGKTSHLVIAPAVLGAVAGIVVSPFIFDISFWGTGVTLLLTLITGVLAGTYPAARHHAIPQWRKIVKARHEWDERFKALKQDPPPRLIDIWECGSEDCPIITYKFNSNVRIGGSDAALKMGEKIAASLGGSASVAVIPVEQKDPSGHPRPGTVDALRFDIVEIQNPESVPSLSDSETDDETVEALLRFIFAQASDENAMRIMPLQHEVITTEDSENRVFFVGFTGAPPTDIAAMLEPAASQIGAEVLGDHRFNNFAGALYIGAFDGAQYMENSGLDDQKIEYLLGEQWWNQRFADALNQGVNPPRPEWQTESVQQLAEGIEVEQLAFVMRNGMTAEKDFFPFEPQIANALSAFPFVSLTGFHDPSASRPAERHRQAFIIRKAAQPVPRSMEDIRPAMGSKAPEWVLADLVNKGFADAKLARPELISARNMSTPDSRSHLWQLRIRLYGGVTLADIRRKAHQLKSVWSVEYLRVREDIEGVQIIAGTSPDRTQLTKRAQQDIDAMEWEQVFAEAGIKSDSGVMPKLVSSETAEENEKIEVKTFSLQGTGLALASFTGRREKLESISSNYFVQPQPAASMNPSEIELVISKTDPMPFPALVDYDKIDQADGVFPIATGLYGETVSWNPTTDPHLLLSGTTGSGKSIVIQNIIYAALCQGMLVYVLDPVKGGADFMFSKDYVAGMTGDIYEAAAIMRHVYEQVGLRKQLVTEHGVEKLSNLPPDVRPPRVLLVLDEFTSLMEQEKPPPKSENPEADMAREQLMRLNAQKQVIGELTGRIAREARSVEITLLMGTQRLSSKTLDNISGANDLKTNLARGILGQTTLPDRQVALRNPYDAPSLGEKITPGRGLWEPVTAARASIIQSWFEPGEQPALAEQLAERIEVWPVEERPQWQQHIYRPETLTEARHIDVEEVQTVERDLGEMELDLEF